MNSKPSLKTEVRHGQLAHVLLVGGKPFEYFTNLKAALCALTLALSLTGCQTMREHPRTTAFIAGSLVLTAGGAFRHTHETREKDFVISDPLVCAEQCR